MLPLQDVVLGNAVNIEAKDKYRNRNKVICVGVSERVLFVIPLC